METSKTNEFFTINSVTNKEEYNFSDTEKDFSYSMKLLSCPFCGSDAEFLSTKYMEYIRCSLCPVFMVYDGSNEAITSMWNTRSK